MNFSPFGVGVPLSAALPAQFAAAAGGGSPGGKLSAATAQQIATANGQVVGVLQGGENGVHYLRPLDPAAFAAATGVTQVTQNNGQPQQTHQTTQTLITLPITMPGAKPGDPQQTVQIQVVNPAPITTMNQTASASPPKYQISQIPIQTFGQGTTVLTVAYNSNQDGIQIVDSQNGIPEGMTVVAALQPTDLQVLQAQQALANAAAAQSMDAQGDLKVQRMSPVTIIKSENKDDSNAVDEEAIPASYIQTSTAVQEYLQRISTAHALPLSLQQFLKFNTADAATVKREHQITEDGNIIEAVTVEHADGTIQDATLVMNQQFGELDTEEIIEDPDKASLEIPGGKKKKKYKKKPPKPKKPKPGQVHIATALDGTTLFCCPECHMAYPEKELLEQHLIGHKIERRFICDICGAGLKRKEHLERHKLGHNPERPFVCTVCTKGFKRKEHLNLHTVIHSGEKTEICSECGKGFYRKDHLRKHARSHATRRAKEQLALQAAAAAAAAHGGETTLVNGGSVAADGSVDPLQIDSRIDLGDLDVTVKQVKDVKDAVAAAAAAAQGLGLLRMDTAQVTIQVPTSQTPIQIPVQIAVPQHHIQVATGSEDDQSSGSTVVLPPASDSGLSILPN